MAKVLSGSETYPKLFKRGSIGHLTAPSFVKHATCSVSSFNNLDLSQSFQKCGVGNE